MQTHQTKASGLSYLRLLTSPIEKCLLLFVNEAH